MTTRAGTIDQASSYWASRAGAPPPPSAVRRTGIVRSNYKIVSDDTGVFHPLGLTWFPGVYMLKHERSRLLEHLQWFATKRIDYVRSLGECDWTGREWGPSVDPDYVPLIQEYTDLVYDDYGMRVEWTIVGGRQYDKNDGHRRFVPTEFARTFAQAMRGREHKVMHYEMANEWTRLDKVSMNDLVNMATVITSQTPNLVALSDPSGEREHAAMLMELDDPAQMEATPEMMQEAPKPEQYSGYSDMQAATKAAGAHSYVRHPRRSSHDHGWSHVRQGYDFKDFPGDTWNNEPEGPQSSVVSLDNPLQLVCCRLMGIMCGGAGYVLHVGQGVTGEASPNYGRPQNMWDVNNIDAIMKVVRDADPLMPEGVENWKCVNNGRDTHPLPLDGKTGFWEGGAGDRAPAVNKNYAAVSPDGREFVVMPIGCKSEGVTGPVPAGTPTRPCHVTATDPVTHQVVVDMDLAAGQGFTVPGRGDTMAAYVVRGRYV